MKSTMASGRFALSLIELAMEQGKLEHVKSDMELVVKTIAESHELELMLNSPIIKVDKKQAALVAIFEKSVSELTLSFIQLVCSKGREALLPTIAHSFVSIYKERMGIVTVDVTSAVALSADQKKDIIASLKALSDKIELEERVDPNLLGGLNIRIGDQRIDASFRRKINELKQDIHNS